MRLFVALDISSESRRALAARVEAVRAELPAARWVDVSGAHLTLVFLGEVGEERLPALSAALDRAAAAQSRFALQLVDGGTFPPGRPARVAWAGVQAPADLALLQGRVARELQAAIGFAPEERPYHPHVTVARCEPPWRRDAAQRFAAALAGEIAPPFAADAVLLVRSVLARGGARYEHVGRHPLAEAG